MLLITQQCQTGRPNLGPWAKRTGRGPARAILGRGPAKTIWAVGKFGPAGFGRPSVLGPWAQAPALAHCEAARTKLDICAWPCGHFKRAGTAACYFESSAILPAQTAGHMAYAFLVPLAGRMTAWGRQGLPSPTKTAPIRKSPASQLCFVYMHRYERECACWLPWENPVFCRGTRHWQLQVMRSFRHLARL